MKCRRNLKPSWNLPRKFDFVSHYLKCSSWRCNPMCNWNLFLWHFCIVFTENYSKATNLNLFGSKLIPLIKHFQKAREYLQNVPCGTGHSYCQAFWDSQMNLWCTFFDKFWNKKSRLKNETICYNKLMLIWIPESKAYFR